MLNKTYVKFGIFLFCSIAATLVAGDEEEVISKDKLGLTIPNPLGSKPFFETNNQNGRLIALHIPVIYEFQIHFRPGGIGNTQFSTRILSGLLSFNYDRMKSDDGSSHGPIQLSVMGITLYDNHES